MNDEELLEQLQTALAVCQCAEDATTEEHIKRALGFVNCMLCAVKIMVEGAQA